jgi:hypothetical protein
VFHRFKIIVESRWKIQGRKFNVERNHGKNARGGALLAVTKERASRQELKIKIALGTQVDHWSEEID